MANPYYNHTSGVPAVQTRGSSPNMRSEFDAVATGFNGVYTEILALAAAVGIAVTVSEVPVASSTTTDIGNGYGPVVKITGTNPITSFGAHYTGAIFMRFDNALLLTNSASLVLPGAANITTVAGDACIAVPIGNPSSGWRVMAYCRMSLGLVDDVAVRTSSTYANPAWLNSLAWSKLTGVPTTLAGFGITDAPTKTGTGASGSWPIDITGWAKSAGLGADIASAATLDLTNRTGNVINVTGTAATSAITLPDAGPVYLFPQGAWPLTYHATNNPVQGGRNYVCEPGDMVVYTKDNSGVLHNHIVKGDGTSVGSESVFKSMPDPTLAANAMTLPASSHTLSFRSATLGSGAFNLVQGTAAALVIPSGATLGTINGVPSTIVEVIMNNGGTLEKAVVNLAGGNDLSETGVISTTAIGAGSTSANVFYSNAARTNLPYRVVRSITSTQVAAGAWASAPSHVQCAGGNALTSMASLGYGQTPQDVTASRVLGVTYYNGPKPRLISCYGSQSSGGVSPIINVNGIGFYFGAPSSSAGTSVSVSGVIPAGMSYSLTNISSMSIWKEIF